ncbi:platelet binding protein GspB isoform X3 [Anabrus simplex]|uniref:platelet binding protein GspB isoform X3 n=1 Tax=Anabrus simplex TaxID=316456 RepID=UPI0035A2E9A7
MKLLRTPSRHSCRCWQCATRPAVVAVDACCRIWRELFDAVRRRRGRGDTSEDDEDLGLPRSPCNSPTTADVLLEPGVKENASKSRSTCSDGSLLSMGSSEMDEDSSGHSSKASLHDRRAVYQDSDLELDVAPAPLSHSAARHKMAVRPKRTHGAPRRRRMQQQIAGSPLPTTPEVNEELSARSASPEVKSRHDITAELSTRDASLSTSDSTVAPLPVSLPLETQLKSASLPPGLALSTAADASVKLARSHSNAAYRQTETSYHQHYKRTISASELDSSIANALASEVLARTRERFGTVGEEEEEEKEKEKGEPSTDDKSSKEKEDKKEESFFGRLLLRRSGKKKKEKSDESDAAIPCKVAPSELPPIIPKRIDDRGRYANEPVTEYSSNMSSQSQSVLQCSSKISSRSSAASRQRIEPINLPPSPEPERKEPPQEAVPITPPVPAPRLSIESDKPVASRMKVSYSVSPPKPTWPESRPYLSKTPEPVPPKQEEKRLPEFITKLHELGNSGIEQKPKSKITGLSSHQHLTQIGNDDDLEGREFSSLITTAEETFLPKVSVKKSRSFKGDVDFMALSHSKQNNKIHDPELEEEQDSNVNEDVDDRLSVLSTTTAASHVPNGDDGEIEVSSVLQTSELHTRQFTKNVYITSTTAASEIVENVVSGESNIKQAELTMKKSSSLDSISSAGETVLPSSPLLGNVSKKSSSIDSISSLTQQVTGPVGPSGISITQTVRLHEESRATTTVKSERTESVTVIPTESSTVAQTIPVLTPRPQLVKRESRPIVTPEPQIPEFLRVQLNRVDSKPAVNVVLSTSATFDTDTPRMQSRLRSVLERPSDKLMTETVETSETAKIEISVPSDSTLPSVTPRVKKDIILNESVPTVEGVRDGISNESVLTAGKVKKDGISNGPAPTVTKVKKDGTSSEPVSQVARVIKENISNEPLPNVARVSKEIISNESVSTPARVKKDSTSSEPVPIAAVRVRRKSSREELNESEMSNKTLEQINDIQKEKTESVSSVTVKSISVVTAPSPLNKKSVVSVTTSIPLSPSSLKQSLKKQDSSESQTAVLKKQRSSDFENISIVEKDQPAPEISQETSYQEVVLRKKSLPWEISLKKDEDNVVLVERPSTVHESLCSQESTEVAPQRKTKSREFGSKKEEEIVTSTVSEKHTSVTESVTSQDSTVSEVVLRKKSLSREIGQRKEEEPELLKVFARRSLKLKDSESEALSQQLTSDQQASKSRDSDKENEGGDSPREERKKQPSKEPLIESKIPMETTIKSSSIGITLNNPRSSAPGAIKYQRCFSSGSNGNSENSSQGNETILAVYQKDNTGSPEKRQRSRTVPESPRSDSNHIEKTPHRMWASLYKENNIELSGTTQADTQIHTTDKEETSIPKFKRIQQRKEEWELRAQQAAKKTLP